MTCIRFRLRPDLVANEEYGFLPFLPSMRFEGDKTMHFLLRNDGHSYYERTDIPFVYSDEMLVTVDAPNTDGGDS